MTVQHNANPLGTAHLTGVVRFGPFEVDLQSSEIRKDGAKVRLEGQPFQILKVLLERPGRLVTREELKQKLWADDTFVDFEVGINAAVKRLRQALDDSASAPRFVQTLPRRGYRFIYPIDHPIETPVTPPVGSSAETETADARVNAAPPDSRWSAQHGGSLIFAIVVTALAGSLWFNLAGLRDWMWGRHAPVRLAVLPLSDLTDGAAEKLLPRIQDALTTDLNELHALEASPLTSVNGLYPRNPGTDEPPPSTAEIARRLDVDYLVEGSISKTPGGLFRVTLRLFDVKNRTIWQKPLDRDDDGTWNLCAEVAGAIARTLGSVTPAEEQQLVRLKSHDRKATETYLVGRSLENRPKDQIKYFSEAIDLDHRFAEPHQGLARAWVGLALKGAEPPSVAFESARREANKALELDPTLWLAHSTLAQVAYMYDWDWRETDRQQELARQYNPDAIGANNLLFAGRFEEAIGGFKRAADRDPASIGASRSLGWALTVAGRYAEGIAQYRKTLDMNPAAAETRGHLAIPLALTGQDSEAVDQCEQALKLKGEQADQAMLANCGWIYGVTRHDDKALAMIERIKSRGPAQYVDPLFIAFIYNGLGQTDNAICYFEDAYNNRSAWMFTLRAEPRISAETRNHPRFQELLRNIRLPFQGNPPPGFQLHVSR